MNQLSWSWLEYPSTLVPGLLSTGQPLLLLPPRHTPQIKLQYVHRRQQQHHPSRLIHYCRTHWNIQINSHNFIYRTHWDILTTFKFQEHTGIFSSILERDNTEIFQNLSMCAEHHGIFSENLRSRKHRDILTTSPDFRQVQDICITSVLKIYDPAWYSHNISRLGHTEIFAQHFWVQCTLGYSLSIFNFFHTVYFYNIS